MSLSTRSKGDRGSGRMTLWPVGPGGSPFLMCFENVCYEKVNSWRARKRQSSGILCLHDTRASWSPPTTQRTFSLRAFFLGKYEYVSSHCRWGSSDRAREQIYPSLAWWTKNLLSYLKKHSLPPVWRMVTPLMFKFLSCPFTLYELKEPSETL